MLTFARPVSHPFDSSQAGSPVAATIRSHFGDRDASPESVATLRHGRI